MTLPSSRFLFLVTGDGDLEGASMGEMLTPFESNMEGSSREDPPGGILRMTFGLLDIVVGLAVLLRLTLAGGRDWMC
jgi:hypothetical protein